jgi:hypothetical protein
MTVNAPWVWRARGARLPPRPPGRSTLPPGEPQDPPTGERQPDVARAVALERRRARMEGEAVDLDDDASSRPREIDLEPLDEDVDKRSR